MRKEVGGGICWALCCILWFRCAGVVRVVGEDGRGVDGGSCRSSG